MKYLLIVVTMLLSLGWGNSQENTRKRDRFEKVESQKIAFITKALDLTPEESQKFWPVYNEYSRTLKKLKLDFPKGKQRKDLSEAEADKLIENFFETEQNKLTLRRNYYDKFKAILPSSKVVKLHMAERKFKRKLLKRLNKRRKRKEGNRRKN